MQWKYNDSLVNIPHIDNAIIITNPPYLAKGTSTSQNLKSDKDYFNLYKSNNLYLIALDRILESQEYAVVIIPESFIVSNYKHIDKAVSITILSDLLFEDTTFPCCVVCFNNKRKSYDKIKIYKDNDYMFSLEHLKLFESSLNNLITTNISNITFNDKTGWLGVRLVDKNEDELIKFDFKENIEYKWENMSLENSRSYTLINIDGVIDKKKFIDNCNYNLSKIREITNDILLSPFKRILKNGVRCRRLTFQLCRSILNLAYNDLLIESEIQDGTVWELLKFTKGNKE